MSQSVPAPGRDGMAAPVPAETDTLNVMFSRFATPGAMTAVLKVTVVAVAVVTTELAVNATVVPGTIPLPLALPTGVPLTDIPG